MFANIAGLTWPSDLTSCVHDAVRLWGDLVHCILTHGMNALQELAHFGLKPVLRQHIMRTWQPQRGTVQVAHALVGHPLLLRFN